MKEKIADQLMEKALTYLSSAEAFVGENVPKFIEELLSFKIFEHLVGYFDHVIPWGIFGIAILMLARYLFKMAVSDRNFCKEEEIVDTKALICFITCLLLVPTFIAISHTNHLVQAYKAYKAPRVYLVDYFKGQK
tara:strand:- start:157 stop:561 length:405 start_codon:yes stop_codon:yes gene_type:complete